MKKIILSLAIVVAGIHVDAQVQRKRSATIDSTVTNREVKTGKLRSGKNARPNMELLKELDLTSEQQNKIKDLRQANKIKRNEVQQDNSLTEAQKQEKLKALGKTSLAAIREILTPEQQEKLKEKMKERKQQKQQAGDETDKTDSTMEEQ